MSERAGWIPVQPTGTGRSSRPSGAEDAASATSTTRSLLIRGRAGNAQALDTLFGRLVPFLERWARGRLPRWARAESDTADLVQEAVASTIRRIDRFEPRRRNALRSYLQQVIRNRIRDAVRRSSRRAEVSLDGLDLEGLESPLEDAIGRESAQRYRAALLRLLPDEQELIVGRIELGYSYEQLALIGGRPTPDAARMAVKRALLRLAEAIADA